MVYCIKPFWFVHENSSDIIFLSRDIFRFSIDDKRAFREVKPFLYLHTKKLNAIKLQRPNPREKEKINLNFYFLNSLWCIKRFHEGLKGLHKTFWGTTKKYEN